MKNKPKQLPLDLKFSYKDYMPDDTTKRLVEDYEQRRKEYLERCNQCQERD